MATLVISYSRQDQTLVRAVVMLLRSALREIEKAVFWDADIEPGDKWFNELQRHIEEAPQLFVFWCAHSSGSNEVRREFTYALDKGKRIVPVLLDNTPLSAELANINAVDLRQAVLHSPPPPVSAPRDVWTALTTRRLSVDVPWWMDLLMLIVLLVSAWFFLRQRPTILQILAPLLLVFGWLAMRVWFHHPFGASQQTERIPVTPPAISVDPSAVVAAFSPFFRAE